ncbi:MULTISPECIES: hypothetical protein [Wolbachia]|uniref:hypothetical protein n=2 Tax=Wolbachieae TaxID=952 RepID=UPI0006917FAC|nr:MULTISPECIES: hypothetical protein [Wolbachia]MBS9531284.1 hypothetical protein [Wolbachia endosymbiont of Rhagoletis cerasi]PBQ27244.1 hypothetical protein BTO27_03700 [Wolbachia pipientis wAus]UFO00447.1 hypothetical protein LOK48_00390 [Wolbachia endosymbiont of Corcyra cephalonica]BDG75670.1 hypothetical protein wHmt_02280 [Wolbachia pipientis]BDG76945.1 hypothetical protein wHmc_00770 [Wolbachia pipientis]
MTTDCKKELLNCISKYREELAENKAAIRQTLTSDKINISDYFYKGDKICNKELFNIGSECQDKKYGSRQEYTYDEWKEKIEKPHAKDLLKMLQNEIKGKILKSFEDYEKYHKNSTEAIKRELDIDSKLKAILKEKQQPETDETRAYYDVIRGLYENGDMRSQLKCNDLDCFNRTIEDNLSQKQSELAAIKDDFLDNTQNIFQHIQVEDSIF